MRQLGVNDRTAWLIQNKIMQAMCERETVKLATVRTFSLAAIADWTQVALAKGCEVMSDGLACFRAVAEVGCVHQPVSVKGRHPNELPEFRWINTVLSNLKTSLGGTFHAFNSRL